jgi:hypothetical protein
MKCTTAFRDFTQEISFVVPNAAQLDALHALMLNFKETQELIQKACKMQALPSNFIKVFYPHVVPVTLQDSVIYQVQTVGLVNDHRNTAN